MKTLLKRTSVITALVLGGYIMTSASAEATDNAPAWQPTAGAYGTAQYKAYQWYCQGESGARVTALMDKTYAPNTNRPGVIQIFQQLRMHVLKDNYQRLIVEPACSDYLGEPVVITGRDEIVPNYGDRFED